MSGILGHRGLLMAQPASSGDPHWANVVSLLHFDGADGGTSFADEKSVSWTASGNAQLDTAQYVAGTASLLLDGNDDRISSPSIAGFGFGTGDFTVECFFRPSVAQSGNRFLFDARVVGGNSWMLWCSQINQSNKLCWTNEVGTGFVYGGSFTVGSWQHVALTRASGTVRGFIAGTLAFTTTDSRNYGSSQGLMIGSSATANQGAIGWVDDVRITKSIARYTSAFTPPAAPFPDL